MTAIESGATLAKIIYELSYNETSSTLGFLQKLGYSKIRMKINLINSFW